MRPLARTVVVGAALCCAAPGRPAGAPIPGTTPPCPVPGEQTATGSPGEAVPRWHVPGEGWGRPAAGDGAVWFLSKRGEVVALDAATGRRRWSQRIAPATRTVRGSTIVAAGDVIVAADEDLVALEATSGRIRWRFAPDGDTPGPYLGGLSSGLVFAGSVASRLYAVDLATGTPRWSILVGPARTTVFAPVSEGPLVAAGYTAFGPPHRGGVVAADARAGRLLWRREFTLLHTPARPDEATHRARRPASAPTCARSETAPADRAHEPVATRAHAGADVARSAAAGADVARSGVAWAGGPVVLDDAIVVAASTGELYAMAREDGSLRWVVPAVPRSPLVPSYDFRPLAVANRLLLAGSLTGRLVAYDLATRCERWRHALRGGGSIAFALVGDGRSVYVPYAGGRLVALDAATGVERWRTRLEDGRFVWPPAVDERSVYAAGSRGLFAFRR